MRYTKYLKIWRTTMSAQWLPDVCPMAAQCLQNICTMPAQCLRNVCAISVQCPICLPNVVRGQISNFFRYVSSKLDWGLKLCPFKQAFSTSKVTLLVLNKCLNGQGFSANLILMKKVFNWS